MIDLGALFNPTPQQAQQGPGQDTWSDIMADPRGPAAVLSIASALAQPAAFGQSGLGHALNALGAGGDSVRTNEALDIKQQEAGSKADLRTAQAGAQEAKAGQAGANATVAQQRLEMTRQGNEDRNTRNTLNNVIRFQRMYQDHVRALQKSNERAMLLGDVAKPIPSFRDWAATSPQTSSMLGLTTSDVGVAGADGGDGSVDTTSASAPEAPRNPTDRTPNTVYNTPRGPLTWTGTGWRDSR